MGLLYFSTNTETGNDYFEARFLDTDIGRFLSVDPLAEKFAAWTPYHYVHNNPINLIDPDGRAATTVVTEEGNGIYKVADWIDDGKTDVTLEDGTKVGESLTTHSFLNEHNEPVVGATIDTNSNDGQEFIDDEIICDNPSVTNYMENAVLIHILILNQEG